MMGQGLTVYTIASECPGPQWPTPKRKKKKVKESEGETRWLFKPPRSDPSQREGEGGVATMTSASLSSLLCSEATPEHRSPVLSGQGPWMPSLAL